jgi:hypothetical protein
MKGFWRIFMGGRPGGKIVKKINTLKFKLITSPTYFVEQIWRRPWKRLSRPVLRIRIRDPVLFWPRGSGIRDGKKIRIWEIRDKHPWSYFRKLSNSFWVTILSLCKFIVSPGSGIQCFFLPSSVIRDKPPESATLVWSLFGVKDGTVKLWKCIAVFVRCTVGHYLKTTEIRNQLNIVIWILNYVASIHLQEYGTQ